MIQLFTLGGLVTGLAAWVFWIVSLVLFGISIALTENEHWGWETTLIVAVFVVLYLHGIFNVYKFALDHPSTLFFWIGSYICFGIVYGAVKWYLFCRKQRKYYNQNKADFLEARNVTEFTPELKVEWTKFCRSASIKIKAPKWQDNIEKISNWMYLWPFSICGMILTDFVSEMWEHLCKWMGGIYDNIAESV